MKPYTVWNDIMQKSTAQVETQFLAVLDTLLQATLSCASISIAPDLHTIWLSSMHNGCRSFGSTATILLQQYIYALICCENAATTQL